MKKKVLPLSDLLDFLGKSVINVIGNRNGVYIDNLADVANVNETTLDWINPAKTNKQEIAESSKAKVLLVDSSIEPIIDKTLIVVANPKVALAKIGNQFFAYKYEVGIHPTAIISPNAKIGKNVYVGPYCVIDDAEIGDGCIIESNVRIYGCVIIGEGGKIKSGAVIGGEGFGFEKDDDGNRFRFPQIGGVIIGDYVEIGGNTCIDRGALSDTIIEDYAKIGNLCQIAHNVHIGRNAMVTACSEISGSCSVGEGAWIGPNTSIRDWRNVGDHSLTGIGSVVVKDVPSNEVWAGNPAKPLKR